MSRTVVFLLCFTLFVKGNVAAQTGYKLQGTVQDETHRNESMQGVTVDNLGAGVRTTTDTAGFFEMKVHAGDTLRFRKLGYNTRFYHFIPLLGAENYSIHIYLHNDTIPMKPFVYKSFNKERMIKNAFLNSYYRDSLRMVQYLRKMYEKSQRRAVESLSEAFNSPVSFLYDEFGKKARTRKRLNRYREILRESKEKNDPDYVK